MIRSIRVTLTLWYIGILAGILCLFGLVLYTNVATNLAQDVDDVLVSQADGATDSLVAFWEGKWGALHRETPSQTMKKEIDMKRFPKMIDQWVHETGELENPHAIRLVDRDGAPLVTSTNFARLALPLTQTAMTQSGQGRTVYETFNLGGPRFRLVTRPVIEKNYVLYLVQVAASLQQADASLVRLRRWLLWLIPSTLVVTSTVGWFLATTALRPVDRMIRQAERIGAEHLHERIDVPHTGDELEHLATTFNNMLVRLESAFRRLRQFSAAASHELRTPLTIMKGELEVALRKSRDVEEYQRVLRTQLEALNEMASIVEQLLMLAHSEAGTIAVEWRPVELGVLIQQVRDALKMIAELKEISVQISAPEPIWVQGERRLLERLTVNLLDNALKHTPLKGSVTLQLGRRGKEACLTVQDTGSGVPPHEIPHIFDRFFTRSSLGTPPRSSSSGLGLGLCRWIAEAHKGRIDVASPPGQGATFTIFLPLTLPPT